MHTSEQSITYANKAITHTKKAQFPRNLQMHKSSVFRRNDRLTQLNRVRTPKMLTDAKSISRAIPTRFTYTKGEEEEVVVYIYSQYRDTGK